jgi:hypothetical protein
MCIINEVIEINSLVKLVDNDGYAYYENQTDLFAIFINFPLKKDKF